MTNTRRYSNTTAQRPRNGDTATRRKSGNGHGNGNGGSLINYEAAVTNGFYKKDNGGTVGKFDNVRRHWEDQITRYALRDIIGERVRRRKGSKRGVRILDLGAGTGQGFELLTNMKTDPESLVSSEVVVLPEHLLKYYKGIDISPAMVEQGRMNYASNPKIVFDIGDLSKGLGAVMEDEPYDIYFSSYGSLSHINDDEHRNLINDICDNAGKSFIFVADLLGRNSYEWPCYWPNPTDGSKMREYSMSYLYPREVRSKVQVPTFPMRYWDAKEYERFLEATLARKNCRIVRRKKTDRSIMVGRHIDTGQYNPLAPPLRQQVNSLHEHNRRTPLETLLVEYEPVKGFKKLNNFFKRHVNAWNTVIHAAIEALERWDDSQFLKQEPAGNLPRVVREAIMTIRRVVLHLEWFRMGDPRANILEPQLGYILRNLEMDLQEGLGASHSLIYTCVVKKTK